MRWLFSLWLIVLAGCPVSGVEESRKGNVYFRNGELDKAEHEFRAALERNASNLSALEGLGNIAYERQRYAEAADWFQKAVSAHPKAVTSWHHLALSLAADDKIDDARAALESALKIAPKNPYALSLLGGLLAKQGKHKEAEARQLAALEIDEDYHAARYALANLFLETGRPAEAEREYSLLIKKGQRALGEYGYARLAAHNKDATGAAKRLSALLESGVSAPGRVLEDPVFEALWDEAPMAAIKQKLEAQTSTRGQP